MLGLPFQIAWPLSLERRDVPFDRFDEPFCLCDRALGGALVDIRQGVVVARFAIILEVGEEFSPAPVEFSPV